MSYGGPNAYSSYPGVYNSNYHSQQLQSPSDPIEKLADKAAQSLYDHVSSVVTTIDSANPNYQQYSRELFKQAVKELGFAIITKEKTMQSDGERIVYKAIHKQKIIPIVIGSSVENFNKTLISVGQDSAQKSLFAAIFAKAAQKFLQKPNGEKYSRALLEFEPQIAAKLITANNTTHKSEIAKQYIGMSNYLKAEVLRALGRMA